MMATEKTNDRHLSIRLSSIDDEWLTAFAGLQGTSKSRIIREGIKLLRERYT